MIYVVGALVMLIFPGLLFLLIAWIGTRLQSPGPVLFAQRRSGKNGQPFTMYKFRSMHTDAEQRRAKIEAAALALRDLGDLRGGTVRIHTDHLDAWLKTLNNLRLVLSVMLDINDEVSHSEAAQRPESDPRAWLYQFYGWLGWMLESLLECLVQGE